VREARCQGIGWSGIEKEKYEVAMTFDEYAIAAYRTATYPLLGRNIIYPALKLAGEAGELADKIGKHWRNTYHPQAACGALESIQEANNAACEAMAVGSLTPSQRQEILKELGDVLWYVNAIALELNSSLDNVAVLNIAKLKDRNERGVICSEGDNR
jgi:NTP pyrophosphatase (non-canonical NTP hydrolase)